MRLRRVDPAPAGGQFFFEGRPVPFREGDSVASALMAAGIATFRATPVTGAARAPYCLMGVCYDCLVRIDGADNQRACMTPCGEGLRVERQAGVAGSPGSDERGAR
ncbi:(2Fe-2S)-binding protein [Rhodobium gokarnense]|uniref:Molibdopterin-dependent oxidoreductase YjgC n=1 Tax=Rhodobium gokarnense TaxID=364296 RepID=A0ABT3HBI3_9HYPH|nr:(2Fe-2S)-binding protein [Rhodobium gokarnense]MCW2307714.1 putative molibdopterin-dependent oxidoreductase YjgC [Rhodobium gokarnense]